MRLVEPFNIVQIGYKRGITRSHGKEALAALGAKPVDREIDDLGFVYRVPLSDEQKAELSGTYPVHHPHLEGEFLVWIYDDHIAVHQNLEVRDPRCDRRDDGHHYFHPSQQTGEQREAAENLTRRLYMSLEA